MLNWTAARGKPVLVEIWFDDQGIGVIKLFETKGINYTLLRENDGIDKIEYVLNPRDDATWLLTETVGKRPDGTNVPTVVRLSQDGNTLEADNDGDPANGNDPYDPVVFDPAVNGSFGALSFRVRWE